MQDDQSIQNERLPITHPIIWINALIMLIVGSFNTLGQKFLLDPEYGNYKHPIMATLCMFYGEYLNYLIFMVLCMIPSTFQKITKSIYENVKTF